MLWNFVIGHGSNGALAKVYQLAPVVCGQVGRWGAVICDNRQTFVLAKPPPQQISSYHTQS